MDLGDNGAADGVVGWCLLGGIDVGGKRVRAGREILGCALRVVENGEKLEVEGPASSEEGIGEVRSCEVTSLSLLWDS